MVLFLFEVSIAIINIMKHRNRLEIVSEILQTTSGNRAIQAKIMHRAYLSYPQLKEYLSLLKENGLIEYEEGERIYRITAKGLRFLQIYNELNDVVVMTNNITIK